MAAARHPKKLLTDINSNRFFLFFFSSLFSLSDAIALVGEKIPRKTIFEHSRTCWVFIIAAAHRNTSENLVSKSTRQSETLARGRNWENQNGCARSHGTRFGYLHEHGLFSSQPDGWCHASRIGWIVCHANENPFSQAHTLTHTHSAARWLRQRNHHYHRPGHHLAIGTLSKERSRTHSQTIAQQRLAFGRGRERERKRGRGWTGRTDEAYVERFRCVTNKQLYRGIFIIFLSESTAFCLLWTWEADTNRHKVCGFQIAPRRRQNQPMSNPTTQISSQTNLHHANWPNCFGKHGPFNHSTMSDAMHYNRSTMTWN